MQFLDCRGNFVQPRWLAVGSGMCKLCMRTENIGDEEAKQTATHPKCEIESDCEGYVNNPESPPCAYAIGLSGGCGFASN